MSVTATRRRSAARPRAPQAKNKITIFDYNAKRVEELETDKIQDGIKYKNLKSVTWVNIDNVPPAKLLQELGLGFSLHPVVLEDIENINQRPKVETLDDYIYVVFKMLTLDEPGRKIKTEQVSLVIAAKFLLSFQQGVTGDTFEPVRRLIRQDGTRTRGSGTDYLAYELIESVVANYFSILEKFGERIEAIEEELLKNPRPRTVRSIHHLKREILYLRKSVWPLREVINVLERVYDRVVQVIDTTEGYRDLLAGMLDLYLSGVSNRTNAVVKMLTIITTIFMPLSFLAGLYGMNFAYIPGVDSPYGFPAMLAVMAAILSGMIMYFRRKQWL